METIIKIYYKDGDGFEIKGEDLFNFIMANDCQDFLEFSVHEYDKDGNWINEKVVKRLRFEEVK